MPRVENGQKLPAPLGLARLADFVGAMHEPGYGEKERAVFGKFSGEGPVPPPAGGARTIESVGIGHAKIRVGL